MGRFVAMLLTAGGEKVYKKPAAEDFAAYDAAKKKLQTSIQKIEKDIETAEQTIAKMDVEMAALDYTKTEETNKKLAVYAGEKAKLDALFQEWEKVSAELASAEG